MIRKVLIDITDYSMIILGGQATLRPGNIFLPALNLKKNSVDKSKSGFCVLFILTQKFFIDLNDIFLYSGLKLPYF